MYKIELTNLIVKTIEDSPYLNNTATPCDLLADIVDISNLVFDELLVLFKASEREIEKEIKIIIENGGK